MASARNSYPKFETYSNQENNPLPHPSSNENKSYANNQNKYRANNENKYHANKEPFRVTCFACGNLAMNVTIALKNHRQFISSRVSTWCQIFCVIPGRLCNCIRKFVTEWQNF